MKNPFKRKQVNPETDVYLGLLKPIIDNFLRIVDEGYDLLSQIVSDEKNKLPESNNNKNNNHNKNKNKNNKYKNNKNNTINNNNYFYNNKTKNENCDTTDNNTIVAVICALIIYLILNPVFFSDAVVFLKPAKDSLICMKRRDQLTEN
eukprot:Pgem_evm1s8445